MIESFRNWINILLCLGIFTTIIQLVMPKNKLRKYIYSLISVITIISVVSPIVSFVKNENMENTLKEVISNIDTGEYENIDEKRYKKINQDAIKENFTSSLKFDIENKLVSSGIDVNNCEVFIDKDYNINKIEIHIKSIGNSNTELSSVTEVVKYINQEYEVDFSKIIVVEEAL